MNNNLNETQNDQTVALATSIGSTSESESMEPKSFVKDFITSLKTDANADSSLAIESILMALYAHLYNNTNLMNASIRTIAMQIANSWGTMK